MAMAEILTTNFVTMPISYTKGRTFTTTQRHSKNSTQMQYWSFTLNQSISGRFYKKDQRIFIRITYQWEYLHVPKMLTLFHLYSYIIYCHWDVVILYWHDWFVYLQLDEEVYDLYRTTCDIPAHPGVQMEIWDFPGNNKLNIFSNH